MRILMLSDYAPPHVGGGVEKVVSELCQGLVSRGHDVALLTLRTCPAPSREVNGLLQIHRAAALDLTRRLGFQQAASISVLCSAIRLIRDFRPDIVHAHNLFFRTTETAAVLRMFGRTPLVVTLHLGKSEGNARLVGGLVKAYESTMGRFIVRRADRVIAVSRAVAEHARRINGGSPPATVIPNGVDTQVFYPGAESRAGQTVLFVGRLVPNKGPEVVVEAVPRVLARHPQAQFLMAGDGPLRERLESQARHLKVDHAVRFLGLRHDVPQLMRDSIVFVRPSTLEGMPLTVLEAMATALPVVATPVGGTPEVVHDGDNGYLVPVGDSAALAERIIRVLDDPSLAAAMGRRGHEVVINQYTWQAMVERTEAVYMEAVKRR